MQFKEVIGHQAAKQRLVRSVKENRVSHAQMFLGAEGSGNLSMALAFAQYLVCENPSEEDSCGVCRQCVSANKLVHPDITFSFPVATDKPNFKPKSSDFAVEWRQAISENPYLSYNDWMVFLNLEKKQGIISAEECNHIITRLSLKSFEGGYKVVVMWLPEKLFHASAPKLLKIIEEPPDKTVFLLVAENYDQVLATITSRTQLVKINHLADEEIIHALTTQHQSTREAAKKIAHRADGNYREALIHLQEHNTEDDDAVLFLSWMRNCYQFNVTAINEFVDDISKRTREKQKLFLQTSLQIARECLMINYAAPSMVRFGGDELESFKRFAPFVNQNNAEQFSEELSKTHFHIERNGNAKILFFDLSLTMNRLLHIK